MTANQKSRIKRNIGKRVSARRRRRARVLFGLVLTCVVVLLAAAYITMHRYIQRYPADRIAGNVYIGNTNVAGMSMKEAKAALAKTLKKDQEVLVSMKVRGETLKASLGEMGTVYKSIDKSVKNAFDYGKQGRIFTKYQKLKKLEKEKAVIDIAYALDADKTKTVVLERSMDLLKQAENATIEKAGEKFKIKKEKEGKTVDTAKAVKAITGHLNQSWNHGIFNVELVLKTEVPQIKESDLKTIKDELASFSTDAGGGQRWQNLKTGVDKINGTVLLPGQEFSVHDATAPFDAEHGYVEAGSYENGQVVDSFGGGICQVSTTLYNSVLYAELEVLERYPHSMLVAYVDPSRDAAIAGDIMDLRFKNSYDTPVLITGEIDDSNQLHFAIYGKDTRAKGRTVEYESETLSTEDYGVTYKEDAESALGTLNYSGSPHTGKTAQLWKVIYQDGIEQSRDVINHSSYAKSDQIVKIGTKTDFSEAANIVRQAIATQKDSEIQAAIVKAKGLPQ